MVLMFFAGRYLKKKREEKGGSELKKCRVVNC